VGPDFGQQIIPSRIEMEDIDLSPFVKNSGNELPLNFRYAPRNILVSLSLHSCNTFVTLLTQVLWCQHNTLVALLLHSCNTLVTHLKHQHHPQVFLAPGSELFRLKFQALR
jgi:predicted small secreted protein